MSARILVIEDRSDIRRNMVEVLQFEGFTVFDAPSGGMGLGILQVQSLDLVICDINLPDFDGYQILRHVRQDKNMANLPFIFVTSRSERKDVRLGMDLGADDYITKPFTNEELLSAVHSRLERSKSHASVNTVELETAKKHLTQMVAHELRTPLSSLSMVEQIISRQIDNLTSVQIHELLDSWKSGAHRLHHLVEQMVLMTHLDSGALSATEIRRNGQSHDVWSIVDAAVKLARQFSYRHPHGEIVFDPADEKLFVKCNLQALRHAFAELISNALDFTPEGTMVIISQNKHMSRARTEIIDSGAGLTTRRLERALQPFEQIDRQKQEQQGMGLGLPLAKAILEIHGGAIEFQRVASGGTKVVLSLPLAVY
ncbi:MAG: response regulator [Chloroflexi bacterium]|nr:response regulator [Chloroflexota bacterium]